MVRAALRAADVGVKRRSLSAPVEVHSFEIGDGRGRVRDTPLFPFLALLTLFLHQPLHFTAWSTLSGTELAF